MGTNTGSKEMGGGDGLDEMQVYSLAKSVCFKEEFSDTVFYVDKKTSL
jgi:hypothetical protein